MEGTMNRLSLMMLSALCLVIGGPNAVAQQKYPTKPVRVLVPFGPGGGSDIVARIVGEQLRLQLGQTFIIDNKPGAFGIVAIEEMARAKPDGYTLLVGNVSTNGLGPILHAKKYSIDYERDTVPVARLTDTPLFLLAGKDFPAKTFAEFIAQAKHRQGKVRYASVGAGAANHLDMEMLAKRAGVELIHVPNKGGAGASINDLVNGDVHVSFLNAASSVAMIKAGQIRPLAVAGDRRLPDFPDVPSMAELGMPDVGTPIWVSLHAPAATPREVLEPLHNAVLQALNTPAAQDAFKKQIIQSVPTASLDEAAAWQRTEFAKWRKILGEVKIDLTE
jgi:tripartite-type tricarboxylate transporter receptor subunit TctC